MTKQRITILGATGSIGVNTLDVIERNSDSYEVFALTANSNLALLVEQCRKFKPQIVVIAQDKHFAELTQQLRAQNYQGEIMAGSQALIDVASAPETDIVMAAIVGAAGLLPTLAAAKAGKRILLANKEALVMAGNLFMQAVHQHQAILLPIDSEHNALFQCLPSNQYQGVNKLLLTASGGPFRELPLEQFAKVTPEQACTHPNWNMGRKISVDSATMMNKALEVIEAYYLFDMPAEKIEVILHPQSIVHSLVEYIDGSTLAQLGNPDMRTPIAHALAYPRRISSGVPFLKLIDKTLTFHCLDNARYPCLGLAYEALRNGGTAATVINAANEVAVAAFLTGEIRFIDIYRIVAEVFSCTQHSQDISLEATLAVDHQARLLSAQKINNLR